MFPISEVHETIYNILRICILYNINFDENIKSHNFNNDFVCGECNIHFDLIRSQLLSHIHWHNVKKEDILSCNEIIIKRLLE